MIKLSAKIKSTPFEFEDENGDSINLKATEYSISDINRLVGMQRPIVEDDEMAIQDKSDLFMISRVVVSVKKEDNSYFWETVDEFKKHNYPTQLLVELLKEVTKLNPINTDTLDQKKS